MARIAKSKVAAGAWGFCRLRHWQQLMPGPERERYAAKVDGFADEVLMAADNEGLSDAQVSDLFRAADGAFEDLKKQLEEAN